MGFDLLRRFAGYAACRRALTLMVVSGMAACGSPPPAVPPAQATLTFTDPGPGVTGDTPSSMSFHVLKVCVLAATRITFTPALAPGTHATIHIEKFGGADATLGSTGSPLDRIEQDTAADGSLGFGLHITAGRPGASSVDVVIEVPGRPVQRITVRAG